MNCLEDCLYLNIWVPASVLESSPLSPVLTWIYGGTFLLTTHQRVSDIPAGDGKIAKPFLQCIGLRRDNIIDITIDYGGRRREIIRYIKEVSLKRKGVPVPSSELGPAIPSPASEFVSPLGPKGGKSKTPLRVRGWGDPMRTTGKKAA